MNVSPPQYVNTTQVARTLGVSVSTVKRWVDEGILPAQKTVGGHRKLLLADVLEFARRNDLPRADLSALYQLSRRQKGTSADARELAQPLYRAMRQGDAAKIKGLIHAAYRTGTSVEQLADAAIGPALTRIGVDWESGRIDVMEEHRASQMCAAALYELKGILEDRAGRNRPRAVGGAVHGDLSQVPSLLAQMVLIDAGWEAVNLGPNTPYESLCKAIADLRPKLVWLSVCHLADTDSFVRGCREVYRAAEKRGVPLAVGGRALTDSIRAQIPYTTYGDGLTHLASFARTVSPRPRAPRRGRPRGP